MKESEIRPKEILDKYLELSRLDGEKLEEKQFSLVQCQGCGAEASNHMFQKGKYNFVKCTSCGTLFCNPRPNAKQLDSLYFESESSAYWSNVFFPTVKDARREKIFKPKAQKIKKIISDKMGDLESICDVGAGHGLFLEELSHVLPGIKMHALEPDATSAQECRKKGIEVLEATSESNTEWTDKFDLVISSEVLEHVHSVPAFIESLGKLTKPGGYTLITCLGYEGFDLLTLGKDSKAISPPHHLNFLSKAGFEKSFELAGFSSVEVMTPGLLDVDIVKNSGFSSEFFDVLVSRGEKAMKEFQDFLVNNQLSSHVWVMAKK